MALTFDRNLYRSVIDNMLTSGVQASEVGFFVVNGTGFGSKNSNVPALVEDFSSAVDGALLTAYSGAYPAYSGGGAIVTNLNARYAGNKSATNTLTRPEFATNYFTYPSTEKVFVSYWVLVSDVNTAYDYIQFKHGRITAATQGGRYNGVGSHKKNQIISNGGNGTQIFYERQGTGEVSLGYTSIPAGQWVHVRDTVKLNTAGVADGVYNTAVTAAGVTTLNNYSGLSQRSSGQTWKLDTFLFGLMVANAKLYYRVLPEDVFANTDYSVTISGGFLYTINSGGSPTSLSIITALAAAVNAGGHYSIVNNGEIYSAVSNAAGVADAIYDSNFTLRVSRVQISDIYIDVGSVSRFEMCTSAVYSESLVYEPVPYHFWSDTKVVLKEFNSQISGTKHLHFVDDDLTTTYIGVHP